MNSIAECTIDALVDERKNKADAKTLKTTKHKVEWRVAEAKEKAKVAIVVIKGIKEAQRRAMKENSKIKAKQEA